MVKIVEVGLRDGLQNESLFVPTEEKLRVIEGLLSAGIKHLEVTSFVHPKWIPQLRDAEELIDRLPANHNGTYRALVPNLKGLQRALSHPLNEVAVFLSSSETHNRKNLNRSIEESLSQIEDVVKGARENNLPVRGYISTVFGCPYEGEISEQRVINICSRLLEMGVYEISLGDTIGVATPNKVRDFLKTLSSVHSLNKIAGHFHDTRGTGLSNAFVALEEGIATLDSALGGMGGCPYAKGASGNLATEDLVYLLEGMGVRTGVDLEKLCEVSQGLESIGLTLPSKVLKAMKGKVSTR